MRWRICDSVRGRPLAEFMPYVLIRKRSGQLDFKDRSMQGIWTLVKALADASRTICDVNCFTAGRCEEVGTACAMAYL